MRRLNILIAVVCGLAVVVWLLSRDLSAESFAGLRFTWQTITGLTAAVAFFFVQNVCMMWRFRLLAFSQLPWMSAFRVTILQEFISAVTPSSVGGSSFIFLYLNREGINAGRSTTVMLSSLFLDELFICLGCVLVMLIYPLDTLFGSASLVTTGVRWIFFAVLLGIAVWTAILYTSIFHRPQWIGRMLTALFSLPILRRWKINVAGLADDMATCSSEIKGCGIRFWLRPFLATALAWCARYAVVDALLAGFSGGGDYGLAFARQWVLWLVAMISPLPGGSGMNEYMFSVYYSDFLSGAGTTLVVAVIWRLITYYSYLAAGVIVIPSWLAKKKSPSIQ